MTSLHRIPCQSIRLVAIACRNWGSSNISCNRIWLCLLDIYLKQNAFRRKRGASVGNRPNAAECRNKSSNLYAEQLP